MINVMNIHQFAQHFHNEQLASANRVRGIFPHLGHTGHRGGQGENGTEFDDMAEIPNTQLGNALERAMEAHRRKVLGDPQSPQPASTPTWGDPQPGRHRSPNPTGSSGWGRPQGDDWGGGQAQGEPFSPQNRTMRSKFADAAKALDARIGERMTRA